MGKQEEMRKTKGTIPSSRTRTASGAQGKSTAQSGTKKPSAQSGAKKPSAQSGAKKPSAQSGAKKPSAQSGAKKPSAQSGAKKPTAQSGAKKTNTTGKSGSAKNTKNQRQYDERRNSDYERALYASDEAKEIQYRRRQRKYNHHRKLKTALFYAAISVAVLAVVTVMSLTVLFNITEVKVEIGDGVPYTAEQILQYSTVETGQNLFMAPISDAQSNITNSLPYIEECTIERELPSKIIIKTKAAQVVGVVTTLSGQRIVLSSTGKVLEMLTPEQTVQAPVLYGVAIETAQLGQTVECADSVIMAQICKLVQGFAEKGLSLDSITVSEEGELTAMYDGRIKLIFGQPTDMEIKIVLAATTIANGSITTNEIGELNLKKPGEAVFSPDYVLDKKEEAAQKRQEQEDTQPTPDEG